MKRLSILGFFVVLGAVVASSQVPTPRYTGKSPEEVVKQFVKMDAEGARLTPEGWRQADALFVQPSQPPQRSILVIIDKHYGVSEIVAKGDSAEFDMGYEELGRMDPSLHFKPSNRGIETRSICKYKLVLIDAGKALVTDQRAGKEVNGPFEWRIEGAQPAEMHMTVDTAIRYVTQMRDKAKDPIVKKDADKTLAALGPYR